MWLERNLRQAVHANSWESTQGSLAKARLMFSVVLVLLGS